MRKDFIILIIAILLILPLRGLTAPVEDLEKQIQEKQNQIAELQKQIDAYNEAIKNKKGETLTLKNQINILTSQISKLETEIKLTQAQISKTSDKISESEFKIGEKENDLDKQKENLKEILRQINEYDKETILELFLKNNYFSDFFSQIQYIENLQTAISDKIGKIKILKTQLEEEKNNLENQKELLEQFHNNLETQQTSLGKQKFQKNDLLAKTKGEETRYQKLLNEIIAKKAAFSREMQELEKQILIAKGFSIRVQATQIPPSGTKIFEKPEGGIMTQGYGMTAFAKRGAYNGAPHNGIDLSAGLGTPIKAAAAGKIIAKGYNAGWGNWIAIQHPNNYNLVTLYAHMQSPSDLTIGSAVSSGSIIGYEGSTGFSTGSHLHFSVYADFFTFFKNGELYFNYFEGTLNPSNYF